MNWLHAFQIVVCKVVSFVLLLRYRIGSLLAYEAWLLMANFWGNLNIPGKVVMRETQCCMVADSDPTRSRVFTSSRLTSTYFT